MCPGLAGEIQGACLHHRQCGVQVRKDGRKLQVSMVHTVLWMWEICFRNSSSADELLLLCTQPTAGLLNLEFRCDQRYIDQREGYFRDSIMYKY